MAPLEGTRARWLHGLRGRQKDKEVKDAHPSLRRVLLATRHDPEILQGTASSITSGCLPGDCRAVAHRGWLGRQFH